jgi:hypothetical protein
MGDFTSGTCARNLVLNPLWVRLLACLLVIMPALAPITAAASAGKPAKPLQGGAIASDPALGVIYVAQPISNTIFVLKDDGSTVLGVLDVAPSPAGLAVDSRARLLYVASDRAGVVTVFSEVTRHIVRVMAIGGRPAGIVLDEKGKALLVTDGLSGTVRSFSLAAKPKPPTLVLDVGQGADLSPILLPTSASMGARVAIWGRGFAPREMVHVYWGLTALTGAKADVHGFVVVHFTLPTHSHLGKQLIVLIGKQSTHSESALLTVIKPPPPPLPAPVIKPAPASVLQRLGTRRIAVVVPAQVAIGPLKKIAGKKVGIAVPAFGLEVAVAILCLLLILRMRRRRMKKARSMKNAGPGPTAGSPRTLKGAA